MCANCYDDRRILSAFSHVCSFNCACLPLADTDEHSTKRCEICVFIYLFTLVAHRPLQRGVGHILCNRKRKAAAQIQAEINGANISINHNRLLTADRKVSSVIPATDEGRRFHLTQLLGINDSWKCIV